MKTVGILALQGCVSPHIPHFRALNIQVKEIRQKKDFAGIDGLVLPGGESTTMLKLLDLFSMTEELVKVAQEIPVWGICAGAILMAKTVSHPTQKSFGLIDIEIERNGYGSQLESFQTSINTCDVAFIRAPVIKKIGNGVEVLATYEENPVWVKQGQYTVTTFHPELSENKNNFFYVNFF